MHPQQQNRNTSEQNDFFDKNDVQSVAVGMSKMDNTGLILIDLRVEIDEICYCGLLLPQQVLPVVVR